MKHFLGAVVLATVVGCGAEPIQNLHLRWQGVESHYSPAPSVAEAFRTVPLNVAVRDMRNDPTVVGRFDDDGFLVRTSDDVAQYCSDNIAEIFRSVGARLGEPPAAIVSADLVDLHVDEGGNFMGVARLRVTVHRDGMQDWTKDYKGSSKRWGRTHNPENFNEALSNSLSEATNDLLNDDDFGRALLGPAAGGPDQPPGPPPGPGAPPPGY